jgi:hypothetical protein
VSADESTDDDDIDQMPGLDEYEYDSDSDDKDDSNEDENNDDKRVKEHLMMKVQECKTTKAQEW